jgi:hypothetical protein
LFFEASALLVNPANGVAQSQKAEAQMSAGLLGVDLLILEARSKDDIETAFVSLARKRAVAGRRRIGPVDVRAWITFSPPVFLSQPKK